MCERRLLLTRNVWSDEDRSTGEGFVPTVVLSSMAAVDFLIPSDVTRELRAWLRRYQYRYCASLSRVGVRDCGKIDHGFSEAHCPSSAAPSG